MDKATRVPVTGETWKRADGSRVRVVKVDARRVVVLSNGEREWVDALEFRATFRPMDEQATTESVAA